MASNVRTRTASTSLMLEILLYFGRFYQIFFWCIMLVIQLYKGRPRAVLLKTLSPFPPPLLSHSALLSSPNPTPVQHTTCRTPSGVSTWRSSSGRYSSSWSQRGRSWDRRSVNENGFAALFFACRMREGGKATRKRCKAILAAGNP